MARLLPSTLLCLLALSLSIACSAEPPAGANAVPGAPGTGSSRPPAVRPDAPLPPGHPPIGGSGGSHGVAMPPAEASELNIAWELPAGWTAHEPSGSMRAAEFQVLPEATAPRLVVYRGIGGSDEANIDRWIGQYLQPDGRETRERTTVTTEERDGLRITRVEIRGIFTGQMVPGQGEAVHRPGHLSLGAIVECEGRKFHVRLQHGEDALAPVIPAFDAWLASLRPADGS